MQGRLRSIGHICIPGWDEERNKEVGQALKWSSCFAYLVKEVGFASLVKGVIFLQEGQQ